MTKRIYLLTILVAFSAMSFSQAKLEVPQLSADQKQEVLYNHVIAYAVTGISFAKSQGVTPIKYGQFIGKQFTSFWDPEAGLPGFAGGIMFILAGIHPENNMQIVEQSDQAVIFKLKNVDSPFQNGPLYGGITYKEYLEFSDGVLTTLANHMKLSWSSDVTEDNWYKVTIKTK